MGIDYWIFLILELCLIPGVMIGLGRSFMKKAPENMKSGFSYRTERSSLNRDTWEFAHRYIGKLWFKMGIVTAVITVVVMLISLSRGTEVFSFIGGIVILLHLIPLIVSIVMTERALKKNFDDLGNRKS